MCIVVFLLLFGMLLLPILSICWISRVTLLLNWVKFSGVMVGSEPLGIQFIIENCCLEL